MSHVLTKEGLSKRLEPLFFSYFPPRGEISVVVGIFAGEQPFFLTFQREAQIGGMPVDEGTIFEIGSTTMVFTTCLLADMVTKKEVHLDDPIKTFLPAELRVPSHRGQEITLLDLANHTSALPRLPLNFPETRIDPANPCGHYTVAHLYAFLSAYQPRRAIGWRRVYSNLGLGLLGHVLGLAARQAFQEALADRVCRPLGLTDTTVELTPAQRERLIQGHCARGDPVAPWDMSALAAAGGLRSTARDLLSFLRIQLGGSGSAAMCLSPRPKSGRPAGSTFRYGVAAGMCGVALAALLLLSMTPGTGWFLSLMLLPVLLAALYGGVGPGLLAAVGQNAGAWLLYGDRFSWMPYGVVCILLAWIASANHRERARPELLGWEQTKLGFPGSKRRIAWHGGETGGYASFVGLEREHGIAVVVLTNCAEPVAHLGFRVLDVLNER